eukprot:5369385-Amphidinium_carterae.1
MCPNGLQVDRSCNRCTGRALRVEPLQVWSGHTWCGFPRVESLRRLGLLGICRIPAMHGHVQSPSDWISDTAYAVLGAEFGQIRANARGSYAPGVASRLFVWPPGLGWTVQYADKH